jgi:hypothetical protein
VRPPKDECLTPVPNFDDEKCAARAENSLPKVGGREPIRRVSEAWPIGVSVGLAKAGYENVMLLAKVARGRRDDGPLAEEDLLVPLQRLTHVVFTHELGRLLG